MEQVHISPDPQLYDFCNGFLAKMLEVYDVVNQDARKPKSVRRKRLWQAVATTAAAVPVDVEAGTGGALGTGATKRRK